MHHNSASTFDGAQRWHNSCATWGAHTWEGRLLKKKKNSLPLAHTHNLSLLILNPMRDASTVSLSLSLWHTHTHTHTHTHSLTHSLTHSHCECVRSPKVTRRLGMECVYVCMHVCICMYGMHVYMYGMHVYMYVCMYICMVCMYVCMYAWISVCMQVCMCGCMYVCASASETCMPRRRMTSRSSCLFMVPGLSKSNAWFSLLVSV